MHLTPAFLPSGIPGIGDDIDIAMQQAPQSGRHSMGAKILKIKNLHRGNPEKHGDAQSSLFVTL
jgi:hypothetical protein